MPRKNDDSADLYAVVRDICNRHKDMPSLNPIWVANEAMHAINFERELHGLGYIGCHLQFRQIARQFCRKNYDPVPGPDVDQLPLDFGGKLQERYPVKKNGPDDEAEYVLLVYLEDDDARYNIKRMRLASLALQKHSDALEAWLLDRRRAA